MANKLELTWYGKEKAISAEPRVLIENPNFSNTSKTNGNSDNVLIHGDNLLALKALESNFAEKIKCIYIDPPYNTGAAFENYDDNLAHSQWLDLMKPRLELLRKLLKNDGLIFVQIDDNEQAYLTVLMDEIFGRDNRINTICVNMSNMSGPKINNAINGKRFPKIKEYILVYAKDKDNYFIKVPKINKSRWDGEYNMIIPELTEESSQKLLSGAMTNEEIGTLTLVSLKKYMEENNISDEKWKFDNSFRIVASKPNVSLLEDAKKMEFHSAIAYVPSHRSSYKRIIKTDFNRETKTARIELSFASGHLSVFLGDHWNDIVTTGGVGQEGNVVFKASKKPEKLIHRIIECATKPDDYVLDSFLGSGTTCAVAHKMKRKWIGIEMGEHAYTHCKKRLDSVIDGSDSTGVTKEANWQNGGGYKFYELAPTLINIDPFGQPVINKEYSPEMLAAAIAIHEGFKYEPNKNCFWKQSKNDNNTFLYVTTNHIGPELISKIKAEMKEDEFLLISCRSFESRAIGASKNITIKKIPQSLLKNCEFGKDNYNLNIIYPPEYEEDEENE